VSTWVGDTLGAQSEAAHGDRVQRSCSSYVSASPISALPEACTVLIVHDRRQLRGVFSIQDHNFPRSVLGWLRVSTIKRGVIFKALFDPRRCIAVPMVFYRFAHEWLLRLRLRQIVWLAFDVAGNYVAIATLALEMDRRGNRERLRQRKTRRRFRVGGPTSQVFSFGAAVLDTQLIRGSYSISAAG